VAGAGTRISRPPHSQPPRPAGRSQQCHLRPRQSAGGLAGAAGLPALGRGLSPARTHQPSPLAARRPPAGKKQGKHARSGKAPASPKHADKKQKKPLAAAVAVPVAAAAASRRASVAAASPADAASCPVSAASPKPESMPMPTSKLLGRARRSPSLERDTLAAAPLLRKLFVAA
jgi:hypothetical protein